jgi:CheY-like chemotaxis protein
MGKGENPRLQMARILVIDDSNFMRRIERQFLESAGHEVEDWMPLSAMEIPERLVANPVDLIITDLNMPGVNGMTVAKLAMKSAPDIPVVVLTALRNTEIEAQLAKFKVRRVLHKPISEEDLQAAINEILGT